MKFVDHNVAPKYRMSFVTGIPLKSIEKLIQASFSVARRNVLFIGVPNQCFPYLNFLGASAQVFWVVWVLGSFLYLAIMTLFCFKNALQRVSRKSKYMSNTVPRN